jgi:hypothetical protein
MCEKMEENILKNIGILETHCHVTFLHTMVKICKTKDTNVTVFVTKDIYSRLENYLENKENYEFVIKKENESLHSFLKRIEKICNEKIDLLFINTFQQTVFFLPRYFGFNPKCKTIMTMHTVNAWLKPKPVFNIKKIVSTLDTNLSAFISNKFLLKKFDALNVIYPPIKDYILGETTYNKKVFTLPFGLFNENNIVAKKESKKIQFVVPGQVEEHRRDYDIILDAFEKLFTKYNKEIELILLGYPVASYGSRIIKRCKKLKEKGYNIQYFESFVPEETYEDVMKKIDFILLPIRIKTKGMGIITEYYGITKGSAGVFEGIQYGKPMVVPKNFNMVKELNSSTLKFNDSKDLENILANVIQEKDKLEKTKKDAIKNSKEFSVETQQDYFVKEILNKLDEI